MNKEELKEYTKQYYLAHRDKLNERSRQHYLNHKERVKEQQRRSYSQHKELYLTRQREKRGRLKLEVLCHYSTAGYPTCVRCGITDVDVLCIDHINGDGAEHRKHIKSGTPFYYWLKKNSYPEGFQILCHNCNWKKSLRAEEKEEE